ncbi:MAG TPA: glutamate racemase [Treponema sp.]|nr:glutamate racemase [Treponema sp.]
MNASVDFAFLDSGTGGIPYMLALKQKRPSARCVYLGDSAHFPYGEKSSAEIVSCAEEAVRAIIGRWHPHAVVIACNTISVTALSALRERFPAVPIVGTVPAIRLAARVSENRRIGFLATNASVRHPYSARLIRDFASDCQVFSRGDPDLVAFVEHRFFAASHEERLAAVRPAVDFFAAHGCDTIILGCTHFTHIAGELAEAAGPAVKVVDSREGVARQALRVEQADAGSRPEATGELPPDMGFYVTACRSPADRAEYEALCGHFAIPWGGELSLLPREAAQPTAAPLSRL